MRRPSVARAISGALLAWAALSGTHGPLGLAGSHVTVAMESQSQSQTPAPGSARQRPAVVPRPGEKAPATGASGIRVRSTVDRTAIWVGDRVVYAIEMTLPPGTSIVEDDVSTDALSLEGLEVRAVDLGADDRGAGQRRFRYVLASTQGGPTAASIGPLTVRYVVKRPGERVEDAAPSGEIAIPRTTIALRSTLPDGQETYALRDARPLRSSHWLAGIAVPQQGDDAHGA